MAFVCSPIRGLLARGRARTRMCTAAGPEARAASGVGPGAQRAALWKEVNVLRASLERAVTAERFSDAARLRDAIETLSLTDEWVRARRELDDAVAEQRFGDAAKLRDELARLDPPPSAGAAAERTWSETTTHGVYVRVDAYYMREQSRHSDRHFLFGYKVRIENQSRHTCQLVSRSWTVSTAGNPESHVRGPGVVGRQPVLEPGDSFEYTSACPIATRDTPRAGAIVGSMRGEYEMCRGDTGAIAFTVNIDPFHFRIPPDEQV